MKQFLKMTLAVIFGTIIVSVVATLLCFGIIGSMAALGSVSKVNPSSGVLKIDMSKLIIGEQTQETDPFSSFNSGKQIRTLGILDAVNAIHAAADDPGVKYIYLKTDGSSTGLASLSEFRKAISDFRISSGKAVVAYMETPTTGGYYLASAADKIYLGAYHGGNVMFNGVGAQMAFLGDLLKELGVNVQLIRHGKYKSAGEMYTRNSSSPENREQYEVMVNSLWAVVAGEIAESRGISVQQLNNAIDNLELCLPEDFVSAGLADALMTRGDLEDKLADLAVKNKYDDVDFIDFATYLDSRTAVSKSHKKIAVIYTDGEIIDGSELTEVAGDRFASEIEKVRADSSIKAVVLRVNSPGGSVTASEKIKHELDLLKEQKPLVASYGAYAASGGYWISNNCDKIFSDAATLTGSIGVFGMIPDLSGAVNGKLKVGVEAVTSNHHGDMWSLMRPLDNAEYAYIQRSIEDIYDRFLDNVSAGRGIAKDEVDEIAQGRVWAGTDALRLGLVDEIGTLEDALRYAAVSAGDAELSNWKVEGYPKPLSQWEILLQSMEDPADYSVLAKVVKNVKTPRIVARMPYNIELF